jgi:hypothetical protein
VVQQFGTHRLKDLIELLVWQFDVVTDLITGGHY